MKLWKSVGLVGALLGCQAPEPARIPVPPPPPSVESRINSSYDDSTRYRVGMEHLTRDVPLYGVFLADHQVLLFGDNHTRLSEERELGSHLRELKAAGMTHLALEMFSTADQAAIDRYSERGDNRADIRYRLRGWDYGNRDAYLELVDSARAVGVPIIALEMTNKELERYNDTANYQRERGDRNAQWAFLIADQLRKDPQSRIVVFGGENHLLALLGASVPELLRARGHTAFSIGFCGGAARDGDGPYSELYDHCEFVERYARELGRDQEKFSVPELKRYRKPDFDLSVHLPQDEERLCVLRDNARRYNNNWYKPPCAYTKELQKK